MALKQVITNEKGAKTTYHRIAKVELDINEKIAKIVVYSYAADSLRKCEKEDFMLKQEYEKLTDELNDLVANPTEENEARRVELSEKINKLNPVTEVTDRHLVEATHEMPISNEFSMKEAYFWLKNNVYSDSIDA